jgi:hypothetical protein
MSPVKPKSSVIVVALAVVALLVLVLVRTLFHGSQTVTPVSAQTGRPPASEAMTPHISQIEACGDTINSHPDANYSLKQHIAVDYEIKNQYMLARCWYQKALEQLTKDGLDDKEKNYFLTSKNGRADPAGAKKILVSIVEERKRSFEEKIRYMDYLIEESKKMESDPSLREDIAYMAGREGYTKTWAVSYNAYFTLKRDPSAALEFTKWDIAKDYYNDENYVKARQWFPLTLDQLIEEDKKNIHGGANNSTNENSLRTKIAEIDEKTQQMKKESETSAIAETKFRSSIEKKKDVGDYVCAVNESWGGYVENVHNDKIQIRVHHEYPFQHSNNYDEVIWRKYNEVGLCDK